MSHNTVARLAGLLYLLTLPTATPAVYVARSMEAGDSAATLARIEASRTLFELSFFLGVFAFIDLLLFAYLLHRLLSPVGQDAANLMFALAAVSVPISLAALAPHLDILALIDGSMLTGDALASEVALALQRSNNLMHVATLFWGLWLFPYGWLVFRSAFVPSVLGLLIMVGGAAYVLAFFAELLLPDPTTLAARVFAAVGVVTFLLGVVGGELGTALWLLVRGAGKPRTAPAPAAS